MKNPNLLKFIKNKKAAIEELIRIILWIAVFILLSAGVYYFIKYITNA